MSYLKEGLGIEEKDQSMNQIAPLLEEYNSLRAEIMKRQDARLYIAGFTMAAIGTILGFTLREGTSFGHDSNYYIAALVSFALIVLNAALFLTIQYTQQIDIISAYIRKFIEPKISGMGWETRWKLYRKKKGEKDPSFFDFPWGTSRSLALFYAFLTVAVCFVVFVRSLYHPFIILVLILVTSSFILSYDLFKKKSKGWKVNWDIIDEH